MSLNLIMSTLVIIAYEYHTMNYVVLIHTYYIQYVLTNTNNLLRLISLITSNTLLCNTYAKHYE